MPPKITDYARMLETDSGKVLDAELDSVVDFAIQEALANPGREILVARRTSGSFVIELSPDAPQGIVAEVDLA